MTTLAETLASYKHDPWGFVLWAFPWSVPGSPLEDETGPDKWQEDSLKSIGLAVAATGKVQDAVASGKGIGKSCEGAWLILWAICTMSRTRGAVTANTLDQIRTKTWPELAKWYHMMMPPVRDMFTLTATAIHSSQPEYEKTWRIDAVSWSANNVEAFAGLHNKGRRVFVLFDEASAIDDAVWDTTDGIMSDADTEVIWAVRGNPTRASGRFRQAWGRLRSFWQTRRVDSREVKITDKDKLNAQVELWGEQSDYVRKYIKGEFPVQASTQFIPSDIVESAMSRKPECFLWEPLLMGVDVARFGDDQTVICFRRGRDACTVPWVRMRGADAVTVAGKIAELKEKEGVDAIFVDGVGVGGGVIDILRRWHHNVIEVKGSGKVDGAIKLDRPMKLRNKRAEIWACTREWLANGTIPDDDDLLDELTSIEYDYDADGRLIMEDKDDMKSRGLASPDAADALTMTFAAPVAMKTDETTIMLQAKRDQAANGIESYNPYGGEHV